MIICGLDEAGLGPLAGPVVAAAVILSDSFPVDILNDSKKMTEKKRLNAEKIITAECICYAVARVDNDEIDRINILQASLLAMKLAFEKMIALADKNIDCSSVRCIADGTFCPDIIADCKAVPKADSSVFAVMAASILAKNERDRIMYDYSKIYPAYGYERHKGYPTAEHRKICCEIGPSPIQRKSFKYALPGTSKN